MPKFKKDALTKMAREQFDAQIKEIQDAIAATDAEPDYALTVADWRKEYRQRLQTMLANIDTAPDETLMTWRLPQYPVNPRHSLPSWQQRIKQWESQRDSVLTVIEAVVADKDGNVNLSVNDLRGMGLNWRGYC